MSRLVEPWAWHLSNPDLESFRQITLNPHESLQMKIYGEITEKFLNRVFQFSASKFRKINLQMAFSSEIKFSLENDLLLLNASTVNTLNNWKITLLNISWQYIYSKQLSKLGFQYVLIWVFTEKKAWAFSMV